RDAPTRVVSLANDIEQVGAGDTHTCSLAHDGSVSCWGAIRMNAVAPGLQPSQPLPGPITGFPAATQLSSGDSHTCAIAGGVVYCWGLNDAGQAGDKALGRMVGPSAIVGLDGAVSLDGGGSTTCVVHGDNSGRCWGSGAYGQLAVPLVDSAMATLPAPGGPWKQ